MSVPFHTSCFGEPWAAVRLAHSMLQMHAAIFRGRGQLDSDPHLLQTAVVSCGFPL